MIDEEIIHAISVGGTQKNEALNSLIQRFKGLKWSYGKQHQLNNQETEDAFMEAIESLQHQIETRSVTPPLEQLFRRTLRYKCIDQYRKHKNIANDAVIPEKPDSEKNILDSLIDRETIKQGARSFRELSKECQNILRLWMDEELSFSEIANRLGYKHDAHARKRKFHCWNRWKKQVKKLTAMRIL